MLGKKNKPFFVAEISSNHNGVFKNAKKLIKAAKFGGDCQVGNVYFYSLIISEETVNAALAGQTLMKNSSSQKNDTKVKFNTYDKYEF